MLSSFVLFLSPPNPSFYPCYAPAFQLFSMSPRLPYDHISLLGGVFFNVHFLNEMSAATRLITPRYGEHVWP